MDFAVARSKAQHRPPFPRRKVRHVHCGLLRAGGLLSGSAVCWCKWHFLWYLQCQATTARGIHADAPHIWFLWFYVSRACTSVSVPGIFIREIIPQSTAGLLGSAKKTTHALGEDDVMQVGAVCEHARLIEQVAAPASGGTPVAVQQVRRHGAQAHAGGSQRLVRLVRRKAEAQRRGVRRRRATVPTRAATAGSWEMRRVCDSTGRQLRDAAEAWRPVGRGADGSADEESH